MKLQSGFGVGCVSLVLGIFAWIAPLGGWPRLLILRAFTNTSGCPVLRAFCEGQESEMTAPSGFVTRPQPNQIAHAASPPTLAKNARMGHPHWE